MGIWFMAHALLFYFVAACLFLGWDNALFLYFFGGPGRCGYSIDVAIGYYRV